MRVRITQWRLHRVLKAAKLFLSSDPNRTHLHTMRFEILKDGQLQVCATDGEAAIRLTATAELIGPFDGHRELFVDVPKGLYNPAPQRDHREDVCKVQINELSVEAGAHLAKTTTNGFPPLAPLFPVQLPDGPVVTESFGINSRQLQRLGRVGKALADMHVIWRCQPPTSALNPLRFDLTVGNPTDPSGIIIAEVVAMPSRLHYFVR